MIVDITSVRLGKSAIRRLMIERWLQLGYKVMVIKHKASYTIERRGKLDVITPIPERIHSVKS